MPPARTSTMTNMNRDRMTARGRISARLVSGSGELPFCENHNALSYTSSEVMAEAYGGDASRIPKYIGFIYGTDPMPPMDEIDRDMTWDTVKALIEKIHGNMLVTRFSRRPYVYSDHDDSTEGTGSTVMFSAVTRTGYDGMYVEDTTGQSNFAPALSSDMYIYRVVLLGDSRGCGNDYTVLGMADLMKNGAYRAKPADYELALDWRVTFN